MTELPDDLKAEVAAAAKIVRRDFSASRIRSVVSEFMDPKAPPEDGKVPPKKTPEEKEKETPKKQGIWWQQDEPEKEAE